MDVITIYKGNPYNATITITDSAGNAYDLTGKTVFFTVKKIRDFNADDTDAVITAKITSHTAPLAGITTLVLTAAQTLVAVDSYKWDIRVYDDDPLVQMNTVAGYCNIKDIVTKRTT